MAFDCTAELLRKSLTLFEAQVLQVCSSFPLLGPGGSGWVSGFLVCLLVVLGGPWGPLGYGRSLNEELQTRLNIDAA